MFLTPGMSAVVEVLPEGLEHKGFRNLAGLVGVGYFSLHGDGEDGGGKGRRRGMRKESEREEDWHEWDVRVDEDRFVRAIMAAVGSLSNRGVRSWDVDGVWG